MTEEDEIDVLKSIFAEIDKAKTGYLTQKQFVFFINTLSAHEKELKVSEPYTINSVYKYLDKEGDDKLPFLKVYSWWISPKKYELFSEESAKLINKANRLYSAHAKGSKLTYEEFEELLASLKVTHEESTFDDIDKNGDGLMSFSEFFDWLGWIKI
jgi:Ca2+-binding EF-hand superfamily protein